MTRFVLLVFACLGLSECFGQSWQRFSGPFYRHITDVQILSEQDVFFMGGNPSNDAIFTASKTPDLGTQWYIKYEGFQPWSRGFMFNAENTATSVGPGGVIRRTTDGGENWPYMASHTNADLEDVFFVDSALGFIVGGNSSTTDSSIILKTINGGMDWSLVLSEEGEPLNSVFFHDELKGFAVGDNGLILRTQNAGIQWDTISAPVNRTFNSVSFYDAQNGLIAGGQFSSDSIQTILRTTDGGETWVTVLDQMGPWLNDVAYKNSDTGYAVGHMNTVLKTEDGGQTWVEETMPGSFDLDSYNKVEFESNELGVMVGQFGTVYFMIDFPLPEAITLPSEISGTETEITLLGNVNTHGRQGTLQFYYDTLPDLSNAVTSVSGGINTTQLEPVQQFITDLIPHRT